MLYTLGTPWHSIENLKVQPEEQQWHGVGRRSYRTYFLRLLSLFLSPPRKTGKTGNIAKLWKINRAKISGTLGIPTYGGNKRGRSGNKKLKGATKISGKTRTEI